MLDRFRDHAPGATAAKRGPPTPSTHAWEHLGSCLTSLFSLSQGARDLEGLGVARLLHPPPSLPTVPQRPGRTCGRRCHPSAWPGGNEPGPCPSQPSWPSDRDWSASQLRACPRATPSRRCLSQRPLSCHGPYVSSPSCWFPRWECTRCLCFLSFLSTESPRPPGRPSASSHSWALPSIIDPQR